MRMWNLDPRWMCRKHLLGEHVEMHMFVGTIQKGISLAGYIEKGLVIPRLIQYRHDELVKEMQQRGYNHRSPLDQPDVEIYDQYDPKIDIKSSMLDLFDRCEECFALHQKTFEL